MKNFIKNKKAGFSLIEVIFYISIFIVLSIVVINALIIMTKAFRENIIQSDVVRSASIMERIEREIKQATSVASVSPTVLRLNTTDEAGAAKIVQFSGSGTDLVLSENDVTTGNLNLPHINVQNLSFIQITTANSRAVKVYFEVSSDRDTQSRVTKFYNTAVLRGSY